MGVGMCEFCNVCGCFDMCVGVLIIDALVFTVFFFFMYIYSYLVLV